MRNLLLIALLIILAFPSAAFAGGCVMGQKGYFSFDLIFYAKFDMSREKLIVIEPYKGGLEVGQEIPTGKEEKGGLYLQGFITSSEDEFLVFVSRTRSKKKYIISHCAMRAFPKISGTHRSVPEDIFRSYAGELQNIESKLKSISLRPPPPPPP